MTGDRYKENQEKNYRRARILIVEDNPDQWLIIQAAIQLELMEVEVIRVENGLEALEFLERCKSMREMFPRLILLDLYLPKAQDGYDFLETIKKPDSPFLRIPVVVFSGSDDSHDVGQAYGKGGSSYTVKPVTLPEWRTYFQTLRKYWWDTVTLPGGKE